MKNIFTLLFVLLACIGFSQCPTSSIYLYKQADVDLFIVNYPNCTEIDVDLIINNYLKEIQNLEGLSNISIVNGDLTLNNLDDSTDISGIENFTSIGGNLNFSDNLINEFNSLGSITFVGGSISLSNNTINNFNGLNALQNAPGDLSFFPTKLK